MPPRNASYRGGPCGGGRGDPLPLPGGRGGDADRWSEPGCIPAGEDGIVLAALNDIQFFRTISLYRFIANHVMLSRSRFPELRMALAILDSTNWCPRTSGILYFLPF